VYVSAKSPTVPAQLVADAPAVTLELESRPETLTLVRGMLGGLAERTTMDAELLDDLKTAISEACNNVVLHAYPDGSGPLSVRLTLGVDRIEVIVRDAGCGITERASSDERVQGVGLPVIRALAEQAEFRSRVDGGTEVWMAFAAEREGRPLFRAPADAVADDGWVQCLSGDAVVSVSPVELLIGVLGRLSRALAASSRFSLDRFSDVYLVTDAIAAVATKAAQGSRLGFAISSRPRRLELVVGPLDRQRAEALCQYDDGLAGSALGQLSDELTVTARGDDALLRVVMLDEPRPPGR
jgi:anti-sigma regulatory factor (Ser/Thr protein kinase)